MSAADAARKVAEDYRLSATVTAYEEGGQSYLYDALAEAFEKFADALDEHAELTASVLDAFAPGTTVEDEAGDTWVRQDDKWHCTSIYATPLSSRGLIEEWGPIRKADS